MSAFGYCCANARFPPATPNASAPAVRPSISRRFMTVSVYLPREKGRALSLRFDFRDACVVAPILDVLQKPRLRFVNRGNPRVAAEFVEESLGFIGRDYLLEPRIDLLDHGTRCANRNHGREPA